MYEVVDRTFGDIRHVLNPIMTPHELANLEKDHKVGSMLISWVVALPTAGLYLTCVFYCSLHSGHARWTGTTTCLVWWD
jgi:hypothetical protein